MSVVIEDRDDGPCRKVLTIEVPATALEAELGRVARELGHRVQIDGFRRGKVPMSLIRRRFKAEIEGTVSERLVARYWQQAEAEKSLDCVLPPVITDIKLEAGEPLTFVAEVNVRPEITLSLDEPFELPDPGVEPTEAEIEDNLEDLRREHAEWRQVARPAAVGDRVTGTARLLALDGEPQQDPETGEPPEASAIDFEIGDSRSWEELGLAVTGLSAGQSTEFDRTADGEGAQRARYRVEIEEVRERELPELDDELAAQVGDFDSLKALRTALVGHLGRRKREERFTKRRAALVEQLLARHTFDVPQRLVEQEREHMLHATMHRMAENGVDIENQDIDWVALGEQAQPAAEKAVQERLLLDAVADARDVRVDERAFEHMIAVLAQQRKTTRLKLRQEMAEDGRLVRLRAQMRRDRTVARLTGAEAEQEAEQERAATADAEQTHDGEVETEDTPPADPPAAV